MPVPVWCRAGSVAQRQSVHVDNVKVTIFLQQPQYSMYCFSCTGLFVCLFVCFFWSDVFTLVMPAKDVCCPPLPLTPCPYLHGLEKHAHMLHFLGLNRWGSGTVRGQREKEREKYSKIRERRCTRAFETVCVCARDIEIQKHKLCVCVCVCRLRTQRERQRK